MSPPMFPARALPNVLRIALIAAFALMAVALVGVTRGPSSALAQPVLELEGGCQPDPIRPNETALISCTVTLTNSGDETASNLAGTLFIAEGCDIPSRFTFIDRTIDGRVVPLSGLDLTIEVGDLAPGETNESVTRLAWEHFTKGRAGGSLTVSSPDDPSLSAVIDLCVDVSASADAPPTGLTVTSTLIGGPDFPPDIFPLPPDDFPIAIDVPFPVEPFPEPLLPFPEPEEATYEVVITNTDAADVAGVVVTSTQTNGAGVIDADPPSTGTDAAGRPTWEIGSLAAGDEARVLMTYGPQDGANCAGVNDVIVVETAAGEDYVSFAEPSASVGACQFTDGPIALPIDGDDSFFPRPPGIEDGADGTIRTDTTAAPKSPLVTVLPDTGTGGDASIMDTRQVALAALLTLAFVVSVGVANRIRRRL